MSLDVQDPVVKAVLQKLADRSNAGMVVYGQSMSNNGKPLEQWLDDLIEELLDAACYATRIKEELAK